MRLATIFLVACGFRHGHRGGAGSYATTLDGGGVSGAVGGGGGGGGGAGFILYWAPALTGTPQASSPPIAAGP